MASAQGGAITHGQLGRAGLSPSQIHDLIQGGTLTRYVRGVYLASAAPVTFAARLWTAHLATRGVLGFVTAGRLWNTFDGNELQIHVVVAHHRRVTPPPGVRVHRCFLPPVAVGVRAGLPCTTRPWTVLDLLSSLPWPDASRLADRALQRGWIGRRDITRRIEAYARRPGNAQLRRLAAQVSDGAAAQSERLLHRLLRQAGITGWVPNQEVWAGGELIGVIDVAIPLRRIAIEVDGMAHHVDVDRFRADRAKQNALVGLGWTVLRFTWADLTERPGYVLATIRRLAA